MTQAASYDSEGWQERAKDWIDRSARFEEQVRPLTDAMLAASGLQPGYRVLELACGPGGMISNVAQSILPDGELVATDISEAMVAGAAAVVEAEGLGNVETRTMGIDWLDSPAAVADRILCRFGYMFAVDPESALHEARRVLKPGGRLIAATWDLPEVNAYGVVPNRALEMAGLGKVPVGGDRGMFRLGSADDLKELAFSAGFIEAAVTPVPLSFEFESLEDLLEWVCGMSQTVETALRTAGPEGQIAFDQAMTELVVPYSNTSGGISLPGVALLLTAEA